MQPIEKNRLPPEQTPSTTDQPKTGKKEGRQYKVNYFVRIGLTFMTIAFLPVSVPLLLLHSGANAKFKELWKGRDITPQLEEYGSPKAVQIKSTAERILSPQTPPAQSTPTPHPKSPPIPKEEQPQTPLAPAPEERENSLIKTFRSSVQKFNKEVLSSLSPIDKFTLVVSTATLWPKLTMEEPFTPGDLNTLFNLPAQYPSIQQALTNFLKEFTDLSPDEIGEGIKGLLKDQKVIQTTAIPARKNVNA